MKKRSGGHMLVLLLLALLLCGLLISGCGPVEEAAPMTIKYVTARTEVEIPDAAQAVIETLPAAELSGLDPAATPYILIDRELLTAEVQAPLQAAYAQGARIIVRGDLPKSELLNYLAPNSPEAREIDDELLAQASREAREQRVGAQPSATVALLIYQHEGLMLLSNIRVGEDKTADSEQVMQAIICGFDHDYYALSQGAA